MTLLRNTNRIELMRYTIAVLFTLFSATSFAQRPTFNPRAAHLRREALLKWLSTQSRGARFVSRNGRLYGMDSDAEITLRSDKQVEVTEDGYARQTYKGTLSVDVDGSIHLVLADYAAQWPVMYLYRKSKGSFLFPADKDPAFRMGARAGAAVTPGMAPYWPFRKVK